MLNMLDIRTIGYGAVVLRTIERTYNICSHRARARPQHLLSESILLFLLARETKQLREKKHPLQRT
jgi:hypothetical protein